MKIVIVLFICCLPFVCLSQTSKKTNIELSNEKRVEILKWYLDTTEKGIEKTGDSIKTGKEFQKVLTDENYRASIYPDTYKWEQALIFIKKQEIKQAFWFFINLYPENETNKKLIVQSILAYDEVFKMDEMMVNTFYTYSFMDPEISVIKEGKPEIIHPDILEEKLRNVKEIVGYILAYRKQQEEIAKKE